MGKAVEAGNAQASRGDGAARSVEQPAVLPKSSDELLAEDLDSLTRILEIVRIRHGLDFRGYRVGTLVRRMRNAMMCARERTLASYAARMGADPRESACLVERLTIKVSSFFRNPSVFDTIRAALLDARTADHPRPLSVWSAGCGQGQEAYSLAILLAETGLAATETTVLGTDIDPAALATATSATYPIAALGEVPPGLRGEHLLVCGSGTFVLAPDVKRRVRLAMHDLTSSEPPQVGSPFDLVCCRNVLIYFQPQLQEQVSRLVLSTLAPGGLLCLGEAEWLAPSVLGQVDVIDRRARLFRKRRSG